MPKAQENPNESPSTPPRKPGQGSILDRVRWTPLGAMLGVGLGRFGGWFVWNFIYGIGSRVITDEMYATYEGDVCFWSGIIGAVTGAVVGLAFARRTVPVLLTQPGVGIIAGMVFAHWGWQYGLAGYFAGQLAGIAVAANLTAHGKTEESLT